MVLTDYVWTKRKKLVSWTVSHKTTSQVLFKDKITKIVRQQFSIKTKNTPKCWTTSNHKFQSHWKSQMG